MGGGGGGGNAYSTCTHCIHPVNPLNLNPLYHDGFSQTEMELPTIFFFSGHRSDFSKLQAQMGRNHSPG